MKIVTPIKFATFASLALVLAACKQPAKEAEAPAKLDMENETAKVSYAIGMSAGSAMARNLETLDGTEIEVNVDTIVQAFGEGINNEAQLSEQQLQEIMTDFRGKVNAAMQEQRKKEREEQEKIAEENKTKSVEFLTANKEKEGVITLESGLQYKVLTQGTGKSPSPKDRVKVHYKGTLIDGSQFDSSYDRGQPAQFGVTQVIKGWTEALQLMKEGSKWQLFIPSDLAYGPTSRPKIPGNSVLIFDVELLEVMEEKQKEKAEAEK